MFRMNSKFARRGFGFTFIELIAALVIFGILAIFGSQIVATVAKGYSKAQSTDEVVQKAQMALRRMSIEFSLINKSSTSGTASSITYAGNNIGTHSIYLSGSNLMYTENGTAYTLIDGVASGGLSFFYYNVYNGANTASFTASTNIIGITLTMHGDDWDENLTKSFTTRVSIKDF